MEVFSASARIAEFREALASGPLTADGAMGTMLVSKGAFRHRCLDELNLSLPALVRDVHRDYLRAGAQILHTNTFGANRERLAWFGFGDKVRSINQAAVRIAREVSRGLGEEARAFVAGVVGPLDLRLEPLGVTTPAEARALFREQMDALVGSGVDLLVLQTFRDLKELSEAVQAAREAAGPEMIVIANVSVEDDGSLACGASVREFTGALDALPVDVIGVNCSSGPSVVLETIQSMARWTSKPLSAMPNAGLPAVVDGGPVYPCSPEYMAQYASRFLRAGVRIVGGCCGTTPEHIRMMREVMDETPPESAVRAAGVLHEEVAKPQEGVEKTSVGMRSQLGSKLASGQFVTLVEMLPPRGPDASKEIAAARHYKEAGIDCVAIPGGPQVRARMSAPAFCQMIQQQAKMECVLRLSARGGGIPSIQNSLLGAQALGIRNVLCGRDSEGLAAVASNLNQALDAGGHPLGSQTSLLVGLEVDAAAPDMDEERRRFERSARAGADYILTRPVFDVDLLEAFLGRVEVYKLPVIAGILPLTSFRNAEYLINEMRTPVPPGYVARMSMAQNEGDEAARAEGVAIAREIVERIRGVVAGVYLAMPSAGEQQMAEVAEAVVSAAHPRPELH